MPKKPERKTLLLNLRMDLYEQLAAHCRRKDLPITRFIVGAVENELDRIAQMPTRQ